MGQRTIGLILLATLATDAWSAESAWQLASKIDVAPKSALVVVLHQRGADLALQVRSARGIVIEQDGPDRAFGAEVVLLENPAAAVTRYELFVRTALQGVAARYELEQISNPNSIEQTLAKTLAEISRKWLDGAPASAVLPLAMNAVRLPPSRLRATAVNACLDILVASGRSADVIELLQQQATLPDDSPGAIAHRIYRDYQRATALWESLQVDRAHEVMEALAKEIATSQDWRASVPRETRHWLEVNVNTTLGAVRIFAGRARGDRKLMESGGDLIAATLKSVANDPDRSLRARATEYLAGYYNLVLDRSSNVSSDLYAEAEQLYQSVGDRLSLASIRNNQAYAELGRGNVEAALRLYLATLELQRTSRHIEGQAHVRARLGYLYYTIGDYRRAEIRFRESIELYKEIKLSLKLIHNQLQLAELLHADNRSAQALALLEEVRAKHASRLSIEDRLRLATQLAVIHVAQGNTDAAERALADLGALDRFDSRKWDSLQASIRLFHLLDFEIVQARIELANGNRASAEKRVERALAMLGDSKREPLQQLQLLHLQLSILEQAGNEQRFVRMGERALALIESIRGSIDFHTQGPAWSARTSDINNLLVSHYLSRYAASRQRADFERAFSLLQSVRARNLRDMRAASLSGNQGGAGERSRLEVQKANQALIGALLLERSSEPLERRLAKAEEQYQLDRGAKRVARAPLAVLDSASVRRRLHAQTQVIVLFAGKSSSYMLMLDRDAVSVIRLPPEGELKALVAASVRELELRGQDLGRSRQLAQLLFPASSAAPTPARLLIEADGVFAAIPFSILLDLQADSGDPTAVTVVPSLSEMFSADSNAEPAQFTGARKDLVIFADPAFALGMQGDSGASRGTFARLPYSRVEAKAIAAHFGRDRVSTFSDKDATIANLLGDSSRSARVLHIAAHGFASPSDPFLVGLGLATDSASIGSGLLTMQHIGTARYQNELVVVSACDSGQGRLLNGEGIMSIARSFLASGAKATLSTLWPVPDRANAEFMKEFYFALTQLHSDPATALVYAQEKLKRSPLFNQPYDWGGFVLHVADGRFDPIEAPR